MQIYFKLNKRLNFLHKWGSQGLIQASFVGFYALCLGEGSMSYVEMEDQRLGVEYDTSYDV